MPRLSSDISEAPTGISSAATRADTAVAPGGGMFAALKHRNFRIFYVGHVLSLSGTWLQITAMGWLVLELTDSSFWLGVVNAGTSLPILFFSLFAGVLADRHDKRKILIVAQTIAFIQAVILAVLTHLGLIGIGSIVALVLLLGISNAFEIPTRQSFFVELVGQKDLSNAIALNSAAFNGTRMVGPAIAGLIIGTAGVAACFYGNAASFLAAIAGLVAIRRTPPETVPQSVSTWTHIREGIDWIWRHEVARGIVLFMATASVLVFPFTMLLPVFARDILRIGPQGLGWLYSATGAGALIGGLAMASVADRQARGRMLLISATALTLFIAAFAVSRSLPITLAMLACAGCAMIFSTASANSLLQSLVPDGLRGRVMSVYVVMFLGVTPAGYLQAGALARLIGAPATLVLGCSILLALLLGVVWRTPRLRDAI